MGTDVTFVAQQTKADPDDIARDAFDLEMKSLGDDCSATHERLSRLEAAFVAMWTTQNGGNVVGKPVQFLEVSDPHGRLLMNNLLRTHAVDTGQGLSWNEVQSFNNEQRRCEIEIEEGVQ